MKAFMFQEIYDDDENLSANNIYVFCFLLCYYLLDLMYNFFVGA